MYRVGIRNDSTAIIRHVRVVVEAGTYIGNGQPVRRDPTQPVLIEHALNVMGIDEKHGKVDLRRGIGQPHT
jgi:hypothetical protein